MSASPALVLLLPILRIEGNVMLESSSALSRWAAAWRTIFRFLHDRSVIRADFPLLCRDEIKKLCIVSISILAADTTVDF